MKDIAAACGTTVPTVSYVLSGSEKRYVNADLRAKILACASEMGYVPLSRSKKTDAPRRIAVVLPQIENIFFRRMVIGIEQEAYARGYYPALYHTSDIPQREAEILSMLATESFSGFFLVPSEQSLITEQTLRSLKRPYVIAERPLPCEGEYDFFSMDNFQSGYRATQELIRAGHRHIGIITWQTTAITLLDRRLGYARALEEANILYRPEYVRSCTFTEEDCYRVTQALVREHPDVTAIVFAYHFPGLGGVRCLRDMGIRIPQDKSVVVIGDPSWVGVMSPSFTHITLPSREVGARAVQALIRQIEGRKLPHKERVVLCGELVRGGSVAPPQR